MDDKILKPKISIIGSGNVGVRCAYALMIKGIARQIVMLDINKKRLEGEVMDLAFGEPFVNPVNIIAGGYPDIRDSDIVIISAGISQKPGQTRLELLQNNVELFKKIMPHIMRYAPDSIFLVVSNPVDILSYAVYKISKKPSREVIGSGTVLDTARFKSLIARNTHVDSRNVHAYILGEHGDSEFALWSKAMIGGIPLRKYCEMTQNPCLSNCPDRCKGIFEDVKNAAYNIIEKKGETSYAIGLGVCRIVKAIVGDENSILPVSVLVEDYMDINDVYMGLPSVVNRKGIEKVLKVDLDEEEKENFVNSALTLKKILDKINF